MRTLVIPDIHNRIDWVIPYLKKHSKSFDEIVLLGDYFDHHFDDPFDTRKTALWVRERLQNPRYKGCLGNHDMPYMLKHWDYLWCPGYTQTKWVAINSVFKREDWAKLKPCYLTQGWLLSHAGAHPEVFSAPLFNTTQDVHGIVKQANEALYDIKHRGRPRAEFAYGMRMGVMSKGGITWLDWNLDPFEPFPGVNQIVGHTIGSEVRKKEGENSVNYALDCNLKFFAIIEDGEVRFEENPYYREK